MDDREIVEHFLMRDEEALTMAREKYGFRLMKIARSILMRWEDAEEVCSDTLLKAWQSIPPVDPENLGSYLSAICRNLALAAAAKKKAAKRNAVLIPLTRELEEVLPGTTIDEALDEQEVIGLLERFVEGLSREDRWLFVHRYFYCESIREISRRSDVKESYVKVRLFRIREKLKKALKKAGYDL